MNLTDKEAGYLNSIRKFTTLAYCHKQWYYYILVIITPAMMFLCYAINAEIEDGLILAYKRPWGDVKPIDNESAYLWIMMPVLMICILYIVIALILAAWWKERAMTVAIVGKLSTPSADQSG